MQLRARAYPCGNYEKAFNRQMGVIWLLLVHSRELNHEEYWILVPNNSRVALPNGLLDNSTAAHTSVH